MERTRNNKREPREEQVRQMFHRLHRTWGPQHWWPADTAFEMIVGAYLTQNTAWTNVELALRRLRAANALSIDGIRRTPIAKLEELIRPAGYFRQKAARLKQFVTHLDAKYSPSVCEIADAPRIQRNNQSGLPHPYRAVCDRVGSTRVRDTSESQTERDNQALAAMLSRPTEELRAELLALNGVGPETADSILLYAGLHPIFVVDAYTKRIFSRHELVAEDVKYDDLRALVESALSNERCGDATSNCLDNSEQETFRPPVHDPSALSQLPRSQSAQVFGEFHGLLVQIGKHFCLKQRPRCEECPLIELVPNPLKPPRKA